MDVFVVALFPEIVRAMASASVVGRAVGDGRVAIHEVQIRDFATGKHKNTDDTPCGGGSGMVMMVPPVIGALESLPGRPRQESMLTPQGALFSQATAQRLAGESAIALVCGRYEGFDERVRGTTSTKSCPSVTTYSRAVEVAASVVIDAAAAAASRGAGQRGEHEVRGRTATVCWKSAVHASDRVSRRPRAGGAALGGPRSHRAMAPA